MTTAVQVQFRRGTQSQMASFTGAAGETNVDTTNNRTVVQDGITAGGWPAARLSEIGGGFLNKFRNGTMDVWQRGTSALTATTSGACTADGWIVLPTGASVTVAQAGGRCVTKNSLQVTGASSVTDLIIKQRIESLMAAAFCSQTVTVQAQIYNGTGGSITPKLTVNRPSAQDSYTSVTADVSAVTLQACAAGAWTLVSYTFVANAASYNGLEIAFNSATISDRPASCCRSPSAMSGSQTAPSAGTQRQSADPGAAADRHGIRVLPKILFPPQRAEQFRRHHRDAGFRPYKPALTPEEAFAVMENEVRRGWRDPELVPLFASVIQTHPSADLTSLEASLDNMRLAVSR